MTDDADVGERVDKSEYIGGIDPDDVVGEEQLRPTPQQHEQVNCPAHGGAGLVSDLGH